MTTLDDLLSSAPDPEPRRQLLWPWVAAAVVLLVVGVASLSYLAWG